MTAENDKWEREYAVAVTYGADLVKERDALKQALEHEREEYHSLMMSRDAVQAERDALKQNQCLICEYPADHDAQACLLERDALKQALHDEIEHCPSCAEWKRECDALKAALEEIRDTRHGELHCKLVGIAHQALVRLAADQGVEQYKGALKELEEK